MLQKSALRKVWTKVLQTPKARSHEAGSGWMFLSFLAYLVVTVPEERRFPSRRLVWHSSLFGGGSSNDRLSSKKAINVRGAEDFWVQTFSRLGSRYTDPVLVLFDGTTQSGCGFASAATGPFYCPADSKVYFDESFFNELKDRFHAGGDFASAYVIAHEVGHHVQHLLGITDKVDAQRARLSKSAQNALSVRLELQADFLAGMWARYEAQQSAAKGLGSVVQPGDIEQALAAASAIGDDRLQKEARGYVVPDAFTHGTSAQRVHWFKKGFESDDIRQGDTFNSNNL